MKTLSIRSIMLIAAAVIATFSLQACNTVAGIGKDVSAGGDAVTDTAEENKEK